MCVSARLPGMEGCQAACKPGSVHALPVRAGAFRRPFLWDAPRGAPRATNPGGRAGTPSRHAGTVARPAPPATPIRSCSRWGLPCRFRCRNRGALLPHRFTLTVRPKPSGGLFSVALSLKSPSPAVSRHRVPVEPGLSSNPRGGADQRPSSRLAGEVMRRAVFRVKRLSARGRQARSSASISGRIASGFALGANRAETVPSRPIRNLVKFHLIASLPSRPGLACLRKR